MEGEADKVVWVNALMKMVLSVLCVDWRETEMARDEAIAGKQTAAANKNNKVDSKEDTIGIKTAVVGMKRCTDIWKLFKC